MPRVLRLLALGSRVLGSGFPITLKEGPLSARVVICPCACHDDRGGHVLNPKRA